MGFSADLERRSVRARRRAADDHLCRESVVRAHEGTRPTTNGDGGRGSERAGIALAIALAMAVFPSILRADKLSFDERLEIERGLNAEFATLRVALPRSKKALPFSSDGTFSQQVWDNAMRENGPAGRVGDQVQITRVEIDSNKIVLEINGGTRTGHWYDHVQVGMGNSTAPIGGGGQTPQAANGSHVAITFPHSVPSLKTAEIRQMLSPIFDFEKHSAAEQYTDK